MRRFPDRASRPRAITAATAAVALLVHIAGPPLGAAGHSESFDGEATRSSVTISTATGRIDVHRRESHAGLQQSGGERLAVTTRRMGAVITWQQPVPACRVIDELEVSLAVRSSGPAVQLAARIVFPHQLDPRTGGTLTDTLRGSSTTRKDHWQTLRVWNLPERLGERLVLLRARLQLPDLDSRDAYIDHVVLRAEPSPGRCEWRIDQLQLGPIVAPAAELLEAVAEREPRVGRPRSVSMRLDRMIVEDYPFLPRIMPYHGESPELLRESGANMVLVHDHRDIALIKRLREAGLWVMAAPPRPRTADGRLVDPRRAALVPFGEETEGVLCWYLGTRIGPGQAPELFRWAKQVSAADRRYRRPILVDIIGLEHVVGRHRLLPGISRPVMQTGFPLTLYRRWLADRLGRTRPGSLSWTWVQADTSPLVIEPEQIELQVQAALAAGFRGIGFWKTERLDAKSPGARERQLMLGLINLRLQLLEPWLATSIKIGRLPVQVGRRASIQVVSAQQAQAPSAGRRRRLPLTAGPRGGIPPGSRVDRRLRAALFRTDFGRLLLLGWCEENAQFVPGQMAVRDVSIVVPGGDETATAWEVTTTGVHSLPQKRVAGGIEVRLKRLDRGTSIILTSDRHLVRMLKGKVQSLAPRAARMMLELAQRKLARVRKVDRALAGLGVAQEDAGRLLARAAANLVAAAGLLDRRQLELSRQYSDAALQTMRILQRAHWERAVGGSATPVSSLWSRCFQTLPDHWELTQQLHSRISRARMRLKGGEFEDIEEMIRSGWTSWKADVGEMSYTAELQPGGGAVGSGSCLRLAAVPDPGTQPPSTLPRKTVTVTSPAVAVQAGELVRITGRVRLVSSRPGGLDGGVIQDSLGGPAAALHCRRPGGWRRFTLVRRVEQATEVRLVLSLEGVGELRVDDLHLEVIGSGLAAPRRLPRVDADSAR